MTKRKRNRTAPESTEATGAAPESTEATEAASESTEATDAASESTEATDAASESTEATEAAPAGVSADPDSPDYGEATEAAPESGEATEAAEPDDWYAVAAMTAPWPDVLPDDVIPASLRPFGPFYFQTDRKVARKAAMYTSSANLDGMYGTADRAQTDADARHRKGRAGGGHDPVPGHIVIVAGGDVVAGPDGTLDARWSPRGTDRPGTLRAIPACKVCDGGRAIL